MLHCVYASFEIKGGINMENQQKIKEATRQWASEFDAIQLSMIQELFRSHPEDWYEVTKPTKGDCVYVNGKCETVDTEDIYVCHCRPGTIIEVLEDNMSYKIELHDEDEQLIVGHRLHRTGL